MRVKPLLEHVGRAIDLIGIEPDAAMLATLRGAESTGRPLGAPEFVATLERQLRRTLRLRKRGRKPKAAEEAETPALFPELR